MTEFERAAFEYTDSEDMNFTRKVSEGIEDKVVIGYLKDYFPNKSFTNEEIQTMKDLIVEYAKSNLDCDLSEEQENFKNDLDEIINHYKLYLDSMSICKVLINRANNLLS